MKILFIGTGSGKTSLSRFHSSIIFKSGDHTLLIDAGDSVSRALLQSRIGFSEIDSILFTHYHADHFAGIAALVTQMVIYHRTKSLIVFTHKLLCPALSNYLHSCYLFEGQLGFELSIKPFSFDEVFKISSSISVKSKKNSHVLNKHNIQSLPEVKFISCSIFLKAKGINIFYTSDIGSEQDLYLFRDNKTDVLIVETTHLSLKEIMKAVNLMKPGSTYLTHIDEKNEKEIADFINNADNNGLNIKAAHDGLLVELKSII